MAAYKELKGITIQSLSEAPSNLDSHPIWYDTTAAQFKYLGNEILGTWSTGGNLGSARKYLSGCGTQTAGLGFGGSLETYGGAISLTEEYDGPAWTAGGNLGDSKNRSAGAGTQTAGLSFGGRIEGTATTTTEEYDGSAWTAGGNLGTARGYHAGAGTQTAGLAFAGVNDEYQKTPSTEEYDGSAWTAGGNLGTEREVLAGCGTQTAALGFGGYGPYDPISQQSYAAATEEYNGTSWTGGGNLATARSELAGAGTQTAGLGFGGKGAAESQNEMFGLFGYTELYDGSVWTAGGNLNDARQQFAGAGTQTAGLGFGGYHGGAGSYNTLSSTEEFRGPGLFNATFTLS